MMMLVMTRMMVIVLMVILAVVGLMMLLMMMMMMIFKPFLALVNFLPKAVPRTQTLVTSVHQNVCRSRCLISRLDLTLSLLCHLQ